MVKYKIKYERTALHEMIVEANSVEEAKKKYEDFDVISDYEVHGINEEIQSIQEVKENKLYECNWCRLRYRK